MGFTHATAQAPPPQTDHRHATDWMKMTSFSLLINSIHSGSGGSGHCASEKSIHLLQLEMRMA